MSHRRSHPRHMLMHVSLLAALLLCLLSASAVPIARADRAPARAMPPHPNVEEKIRRGEIQAPQMTDQIAPDAQQADGALAPEALTGSIRALAVLVDFSDRVSSVQATFFDSLIFAPPVPGRGSVSDYFNEVSYGQVDIVTVNLPSALGWKRAPQTQSYYVNNNYCTDGVYPNNCQKLAEDIVDAVNGVVDFSQYDNNGDKVMEPIMLIHSGPGAEYTGSRSDIWSHSWGLRSARSYDGVTISKYVIMPEYWGTATTRYDMTIGVFAHEMGHGFWSLPDLYDRDDSSEGIGNWSLMAGGSWNGPSGLGGSPAWPDAFSRIRMGYTSPTALAANALGQSIPQVGASATGTIFKLKNSVLASQEYFLVENRQKTAGGYDEYLPGSGLAIWHVDEAKAGNQNDVECISDPHSLCGSSHYEVALEQSDGLRDLEYNRNRGDNADLFPGSTNNTNWNGATHPESSSWYTSAATNIAVNSISASAATMTADLLISSGPPPAPTLSINDVAVAEGNSGTTNATFTVSLSSAAPSAITVGWATADNTATAGSDYVANSGVVSFAAGESSKTVAVLVNGDTAPEPNETFYVNLSGPVGATIADSQGVGTIQNDDVDPATVMHVSDLDGTKTAAGRKWNASVTITVRNGSGVAVSGATVTGSWAGKGSTACTTTTTGQCSMTKTGLTSASIVFTVTNVSKSGFSYNASLNSDPEGDSNGTSITIAKP